MSKQIASYTALFMPAEEGGYYVLVPALEGCYSQGETLKEAEKNVKEAIQLYLETLSEDGLSFPTDRSARVKQVVVAVSSAKA